MTKQDLVTAEELARGTRKCLEVSLELLDQLQASAGRDRETSHHWERGDGLSLVATCHPHNVAMFKHPISDI